MVWILSTRKQPWFDQKKQTWIQRVKYVTTSQNANNCKHWQWTIALQQFAIYASKSKSESDVMPQFCNRKRFNNCWNEWRLCGACALVPIDGTSTNRSSCFLPKPRSGCWNGAGQFQVYHNVSVWDHLFQLFLFVLNNIPIMNAHYVTAQSTINET